MPRLFSSRACLAVVTALLVVVLASNSGAGGKAKCEEPLVFSDATLNTYIRGFRGVSEPSLPMGEAGEQLAVLLQFASLSSQIGYGSLGIIYLTDNSDRSNVRMFDPPDCSSDMILARITGRKSGSQGELQKGHAAVVLSGWFEELEGKLYLLMQVDFLRREVDETIEIPLPDINHRDLNFTGQLPRTSINLSPRKFARTDLSRIEQAYQDNILVRDRPDTTAAGAAIDIFQNEDYAFSITRADSRWLELRFSSWRSGWVKVPEAIGETGLRDLLPDLYFLDATAIYLQTRALANSLSPDRYRRHLRDFEEHRRQFEKRARPGADQSALGLLYAMHGFLLLSGPEAETGIEQAAADFAKAADLMPTNGNAQVLASLARFAKKYFAHPSGVDSAMNVATSQLELELLKAIDAEPGNFNAKVNLERLYVLRERLGDTGWATERVAQLRNKLRSNAQLEALVPKH